MDRIWVLQYYSDVSLSLAKEHLYSHLNSLLNTQTHWIGLSGWRVFPSDQNAYDQHHHHSRCGKIFFYFSVSICYIVHDVIHTRKSKRKKVKLLIRNHSVCPQDQLTRMMSSRIWFFLVVIQTSVEDPHSPKTYMAQPLACTRATKPSC